MSRDAKYIIQLEGPFGDNEIQKVIDAIDATTPSFGFKLWDYDVIQGETKWAHDEEIVAAAKLSTPIQVMRRYDDDFWIEVWNIKTNPTN